MPAIQVQFTTDSEESATSIVTALLDERLIACGQVIGPIVSRYRWHGALEASREWLAVLKTREELAERVIAFVDDLHPYETPEILVVPVIGGNQDYLDWIEKETVRG